MPLKIPAGDFPGLREKLANIDRAASMSRDSESVRLAAVISGSDADRDNWEKLFASSSKHIFNSDGTTAVFSLRERTGDKTREGNLLGTLLAYSLIKDMCPAKGINYRNHVTLIGMLFGRGERISPITQAKGNRKPAINVAPGAVSAKGAEGGHTSIEEALHYFTPVAGYLETRGFRGILDKWGDETEIASVDLTRKPSAGEDMSGWDIVKFVSVVEVTEELAAQKEWVLFDEKNNMVRQIARGPRRTLAAELEACGIKAGTAGKIKAGVSLGPVAVSYNVLDIALEIFGDEIKKPGVVLDFDPYFLMALAMADGKEAWAKKTASDAALGAIAGKKGMVPDFFEKVATLKDTFRRRHGRPLNIKVFDMGPRVYWADIGQHISMRRKFMALNDSGEDGFIARHISGIPDERDADGNILVNSAIGAAADVRDSVIVNSRIEGPGKVRGSVIIDSEFGALDAEGAFSVRSVRRARTRLAKRSGLFESLGDNDLDLKEGERHVSLLAPDRKYDLKVTEDMDLRDRSGSFDIPLSGNEISFNDAYRMMDGVGMEELERRRAKVVEGLKKGEKTAPESKGLKFGTSGLRDTVANLTDKEVYINTRGFVKFLKEKGEVSSGAYVAVGGDLRSSTPRIMAAVVRAVEDEGLRADVVGFVPSPVLANHALLKGTPSIMVTGSHIPADRNGIKFTKRSGEVLKDDEAAILRNVASRREAESAVKADESLFDKAGAFRKPVPLPEGKTRTAAEEAYINRYTCVLPAGALKGRKIVVYQHSAVGRDILTEVLKRLGAEVVPVGRSDEFLPVDTEKVSPETIDVLKSSADRYKPDAVVSMDGDSDRPLVADERGRFIPGDKLGALVSMYLQPDFAAVPVSANPAIIKALSASGIEVRQTRIGSPYVIAAMNSKLSKDPSARVVSWESNGGFLTGSDWDIGGKKLKALPTRDAVLPILAVLLLAGKRGKKISDLVAGALPAFFTAAGVVDNMDKGAEAYTSDMGRKLVSMFTPSDARVEEASYSGGMPAAVKGAELTPALEKELSAIKSRLEKYFGRDKGFGEIVRINFVDGIRMTFAAPGGKEEISHIRPSGNAPEFRNYAAADTEERASAIADMRYKIVPEMVRDLLKEGFGEGDE